jgi:hypothetical protein
MSESQINSRLGDEMSTEGPVINWDRIIHKNVRTADNQGMGKVIAVPDNEDTIIISSQSADDIYKVPRSMVAGFNGAEVQLGIPSQEPEPEPAPTSTTPAEMPSSSRRY